MPLKIVLIDNNTIKETGSANYTGNKTTCTFETLKKGYSYEFKLRAIAVKRGKNYLGEYSFKKSVVVKQLAVK